jgi:hypothetical protein
MFTGPATDDPSRDRPGKEDQRELRLGEPESVNNLIEDIASFYQ